jgi:hypothetical protein
MSTAFDPLYVVEVWGHDFSFQKAFHGEGPFAAATDYFDEQRARPDVTLVFFLRKDGGEWVDVVEPFHQDVADEDEVFPD